MLITLHRLIGKKVDLFIGGHFIQGIIVDVDLVNKQFVFNDDPDVWTASIDSVDMVREITC